jgi:hypothetical protein
VTIKPRETDLSRAIQKELERAGHWVHRLQSGKVQTKHGSWLQLCKAGTPDIMVIKAGPEFVFLEIKTPAGTVSEDQEAWHERARELGVKVVVVRSVSEALEAVGKVAK